MDVMGLERVNFVGHSGGGWLGTLFGYESPQRLNKLVLVCPGGSRQRNLAQMVDWKPPSEVELAHGVEQILGVGADAEMRKRVYNTYLEKLRKPDHVEAFAKLMSHMTNPMTRERYNTLRRLSHIPVPTLVLWGTDDLVNDLSMGIDVVKGIKGSKLIVYNGVGHGIPQEIPNQFARDVLDFLAPSPLE
jgi:pimeloyl-ACP methyl ester carboxylesterase